MTFFLLPSLVIQKEQYLIWDTHILHAQSTGKVLNTFWLSKVDWVKCLTGTMNEMKCPWKTLGTTRLEASANPNFGQMFAHREWKLSSRGFQTCSHGCCLLTLTVFPDCLQKLHNATHLFSPQSSLAPAVNSDIPLISDVSIDNCILRRISCTELQAMRIVQPRLFSF